MGEGGGGAIRFTGLLGLRVQRPEQQPGTPLAPLGLRSGTRERGSGEMPPDPRPRLHQEEVLVGSPALLTVR